MSQHDTSYALAIFAVLKGRPEKALLVHLKRSRRGYFKQALREIKDIHAPRLPEIAQYCQD